jgi:linoleate 10R-lipoxygenase
LLTCIAGAFGANNVPDILKHVEVLGIKQARKWQVATLNEFRKFFNLKPHTTFEDINPDPYVADTL